MGDGEEVGRIIVGAYSKPSIESPDTAFADGGVHRIRRKIKIARPLDESLIAPHLREQRRILDRLEHPEKKRLPKLDFPGQSLCEPDGKPALADRLHADDSRAFQHAQLLTTIHHNKRR